MSDAVELIDCGDRRAAALCILKAELHPRLYFSQEMRTLTSSSIRAPGLYRDIDKWREELVRAVAGEVEEIAERYFGFLVGEVLAYEDIVQEALLLAYQYTLVYDPSKGKHPTKWSSFSYAMVEKALRNFIAERTRNIQVPRSIQDRYRTVKKAMEKTPTEDRKVLAALSNQIIIKKKGSIKKEEIFTAREVDNLLFAVSGPTISLNTFVHSGDDGARALYEAIDSGLPNSEEIIGHKEVLEEFRVLVSNVLDYEETEVLFLRYGIDREGRSRTINEVIRDHDGPYRNKLHITAMIEKAEGKLRESKEEFEEIKREVYSGCKRY
jgi:DNA-directed RNA polymerase sigma subunit (sigma70/sigma32)